MKSGGLKNGSQKNGLILDQRKKAEDLNHVEENLQVAQTENPPNACLLQKQPE